MIICLTSPAMTDVKDLIKVLICEGLIRLLGTKQSIKLILFYSQNDRITYHWFQNIRSNDVDVMNRAAKYLVP